MIVRILAFVLAPGLYAEAPPPRALVHYIHDGHFDPGDYTWLKGAFPDANPGDKTNWKTIADWQTACVSKGQARVRTELMALGIRDPKVPPAPYSSPLCAAVGFYTAARIGRSSFAEFQRDTKAARPIVRTFLFATGIAEEQASPRNPTLADKLAARPMAEQMLRVASSWGDGGAKEAPSLPSNVRAIVVAELGAAISEHDHANTEWLKAIVAKQGWPRRSDVGEHQANSAWLLVQHADMDPAFQLQALRLMEPLIGRGEASKQNYAYLYDRVFLKTTGKQRYATQMTCSGGKYVPLPLESETALPRRRAEAGLPSMQSYVEQMRAMAGDCPVR